MASLYACDRGPLLSASPRYGYYQLSEQYERHRGLHKHIMKGGSKLYEWVWAYDAQMQCSIFTRLSQFMFTYLTVVDK